MQTAITIAYIIMIHMSVWSECSAQLLGVIGTGNAKATEEMTNILAKVAATRTSARSTTACDRLPVHADILAIENVKMLLTLSAS
jgi:hypothetical protein